MSVLLSGLKKGCIFFFLIGWLLIGLTPTDAGWYYDLPSDYVLQEDTYREIGLLHTDDPSSGGIFAISDFVVVEFCHDTRYIGLIGIKTPGKFSGTVSEIRDFTLYYYLVDTETDTKEGPLSQEEYEARIEELGITTMCDWMFASDLMNEFYGAD